MAQNYWNLRVISALYRRTLTSTNSLCNFHRNLSTSSFLPCPNIEVIPQSCLQDVQTSIKISNGKPGEHLTIKSSLLSEKGKLFHSNAHYICDNKGEVDVNYDASIGGSYKGVFPAGLLTTLKPGPEHFKHSRLKKSDTSTPYKITLSVHNGHEHLEKSTDSVASINIERHFTLPGVRRIPVRGERIRGALYLPSGPGPFPGVIDMFGGIGGLVEHRSALLASRGIASLALAYFNYDDLPNNLKNIDLEYFEEAVSYLLSYSGVIPDRCGVYATCMGVSFGLLMATTFDKVKALVAVNGIAVLIDSIVKYKGKQLYEGIQVGPDTNHMILDEETNILYPNKDVWYKFLQSDHPQMIPIETANDDTHFLLINGLDDPCGTYIGASALKERMDAAGKRNIKLINYNGAGHLIEPPYGPFNQNTYQSYWPYKKRVGGDQSRPGVVLYWGGNPKDHSDAQEKLWKISQSYIMKHIRDDSNCYQNWIKKDRNLIM